MEFTKLFSKKKKTTSSFSLEALKDIGFITGVLVTLNKALKAKLEEQQTRLFHKKNSVKESQGNVLLFAGLLGGLVAGAITALFLAPESGSEFRGRVTGMFGNGHDEESAIKQASQKAEELAETAREKAERAEQDINDN